MRKLEKVEKILIFLIAVAVMCAITTGVSASGSGDANDLSSLVSIPQGANNVAGNKASNTASNNTSNTAKNTTNNVARNLTVTNNSTNTTPLPKTGVNDTIMWVLIAACGIAALYTYKKVRDYDM